MPRHVFALDLIADAALISAYRDRHAAGAVWRDVVRDIRDRGFVDMEIWQVADRLVMIAEVTPDFPRPANPSLQATVARWEAEMAAYQRPIRAGADKWLPMERIFTLADQS
ncbi:MAG TPA: L-rhamnose mutarotase [Sphingomonas sp.]|nr:L-rhamnose mutarotase [Sphingomonas sp.]